MHSEALVPCLPGSVSRRLERSFRTAPRRRTAARYLLSRLFVHVYDLIDPVIYSAWPHSPGVHRPLINTLAKCSLICSQMGLTNAQIDSSLCKPPHSMYDRPTPPTWCHSASQIVEVSIPTSPVTKPVCIHSAHTP